MEIKELKVTIGEVYEGYFNDAEEGVTALDDNLDIRPKYQREFVYDDKKRNEVIRTVMKGLPFISYCLSDHESRYVIISYLSFFLDGFHLLSHKCHTHMSVTRSYCFFCFIQKKETLRSPFV